MTLTQQQPKTTAAKRLEGKIALVTGASRGIGAAIALRLAEEGASIAVNYVCNKDAEDGGAADRDDANTVVAQIAELGSKAVAFQGDVTSEKESKRLIEEVGNEFGKIDILVNNAGAYEGLPIEEVTEQHIDHLLGVNFKGVILITKEALKCFADGGRIINISSVAATTSRPNLSIYAASKAALDSLTRIWAQELGRRQITVNGVAPGPTTTCMFNSVPEELKQHFIESTALKRMGKPEDIAAVVAFLASDDGRWVTGETIVASGGILT